MAETFTQVRARLAAAQKPNKGTPAYSRYINRPLGRTFAAAAFLLGLTPNQVTAISAVCSAAGLVILAAVPPSLLSGISVATLLALGYGLDAADGQLARLRGGGSLTGEWLDHVVDAIKTVTLQQITLFLFIYRYHLDLKYVAVGMVATVAFVVEFFIQLLNEALRAKKHTGPPPPPPAASSIWRSLAGLPIDYGFLCLVYATIGFPKVFVPLYVLITAGSLAYLLLGLVKWYRDMRALDAQ